VTWLAALAVLSALAAVGLLLHPARPWDARPVGEDERAPPDPPAWPSLVAIVPARNEAATLPLTLPALLRQEYPGDFHVVLVDDRSTDGTAEAARREAAAAGVSDRLEVVAGEPLPGGWVGKVWALQQGARRAHARGAAYVLLTDADIVHGPASARRLVAEAVASGLALDSRMARLRCETFAERLLVPAFVWFFNVLYPLRWVGDPVRPEAAAAGGCVLLSAEALEAVGGFACIADRIIDDVSLAQEVKRADRPIRLALSREDVRSVRAYPRVRDVWRMVRRTAFTELRTSWLRLAACLAVLGVVFGAPVAATVAGVLHAGALPCALAGVLAWALWSRAFLPAVRHFELDPPWALALPLAGLVYGAMTLDSAVRHALRRRDAWGR
jgi:hopene-associated glycosyltransferase HpnB